MLGPQLHVQPQHSGLLLLFVQDAVESVQYQRGYVLGETSGSWLSKTGNEIAMRSKRVDQSSQRTLNAWTVNLPN